MSDRLRAVLIIVVILIGALLLGWLKNTVLP